MISFSSALRSHGKVTLPSVDNGWLINSSIVKDPPKSITTRRIDKVGDAQMIVDMIEDNGDRICGSIMKFPRGVNPAGEMADPLLTSKERNATIQNNSNNAVRPSTDPGYRFSSQFGRGSGGYLARRIMMYAGAFRPPLYTQEQLLPLSRQPRLRTSCITHPEKINYTASPLESSADYAKSIRKDLAQFDAVAPCVDVRERSGQYNLQPMDYIQDEPIQIANVTAGLRPRDLTIQENQVCRPVTELQPTTAYANTSRCSEKITRDSMMYAYQKPPQNEVHEQILKSYVNPRFQLGDRDANTIDTTNISHFIMDYPKASAGQVVSAPGTCREFPQMDIDTKFYLHDDPCRAENIIAAPTVHRYTRNIDSDMDNYHAIRDENINCRDVIAPIRIRNDRKTHASSRLDLAKFINTDAIVCHDVDAGMGGSSIINKSIYEAGDKGLIKLRENDSVLDAYANVPMTSYDKNNYIHSKVTQGKCKAIKQYETKAPISDFAQAEPINRSCRLTQKLDLSPYSLENVGAMPMQSYQRAQPSLCKSVRKHHINRDMAILAAR